MEFVLNAIASTWTLRSGAGIGDFCTKRDIVNAGDPARGGNMCLWYCERYYKRGASEHGREQMIFVLNTILLNADDPARGGNMCFWF